MSIEADTFVNLVYLFHMPRRVLMVCEYLGLCENLSEDIGGSNYFHSNVKLLCF